MCDEAAALEGDADDAVVVGVAGGAVAALAAHLPGEVARPGGGAADKPHIRGAADRRGLAAVADVGQIDVVRGRPTRHAAVVARADRYRSVRDRVSELVGVGRLVDRHALDRDEVGADPDRARVRAPPPGRPPTDPARAQSSHTPTGSPSRRSCSYSSPPTPSSTATARNSTTTCTCHPRSAPYPPSSPSHTPSAPNRRRFPPAPPPHTQPATPPARHDSTPTVGRNPQHRHRLALHGLRRASRLRIGSARIDRC